ncbi:ABC transporter permease [Roseomonas gilardii]|uniref:ABC transporter permease n=1 Tax=Roseomonas gilardii TaxID=257708 RepID=UPI0011A447DB|nr:ABC transporter permease [Roseomonas gilardii]
MPAGPVARILATLGFLFLVLPLAIVIPVSFSQSALLQFPPRGVSLRWYRVLFDDPQWMAAFRNSLSIGLMVAFVSVVLATMAALALSRRPVPGAAALRALLLAPLVVPVVISAVALFYLFSLLGLTGTTPALVIAHTVLTFPYCIIVVGAALERLDPRQEQAAMSLGAGPLRCFLHVTLPTIRPAVLAAWIFAFLISFDEVVVSMFLASPATETLPVKMWQGIRFDLDPTIAAVSTLLVLFSGLLVMAGDLLRRRVAGGRRAP